MKKALLALPLLLAGIVTSASAQVEIGLKVSPSIASLRVDAPGSLGFASDGSKLGIGGGVIVDYFFGQNYAFSSGLLLTSKGGKINYLDQTAPNDPTQVRRSQEISLQYLEIPVTVKLFTNDVATDTKLYFQVGGTVNAAVAGRINSSKYYTDPATATELKASKHFIIPDAALLAGLGVEYQLGQSTRVFAGLSYHRGLFNIDRYFEKERSNMKGVTLKNNELALDFGLKF
ncbi:porin family protein [Hymenobacter sp. B81]|uniref:porin family protein n=1 Tax=Hymenobacter sp. B81 TaxID=3344878 RepID=UPI0037DD156E